jgi:hypothetical protein
VEVSLVQVNTLIRLGALAFNVAQDQKVQELFTMIHKGAKRRGIIGPVPNLPAPPQAQKVSAPAVSPVASAHPIPFAPVASPVSKHPPGQDLGKYINGENAKKVLGWAGQIANLLVKE